MLNSKFPILFAFHDVVDAARERHSEIYDKWCAIDISLARLRKDTNSNTRFHLDANVDLVLRLAEEEQAECFVKYSEHMMGGSAFFQIALSKMWLFSTFELLRSSCEHSECKPNQGKNYYCKEPDCYRCKVLCVKQNLSTFRVHLGKLETTTRRGGPSPERGIPELVFGANGSIGWRSRDSDNSPVMTSRLQLSDEILAALYCS